MESILGKRLTEHNVTFNDILLKIGNINNEDMIFAYTSQMEGLGTKDSDIDIYVLTENSSNIAFVRKDENRKVQMAMIQNLIFDIEYWEISHVNDIITRVNCDVTDSFNVNELKLLHRLKESELLSECGSSISSAIEMSNLKKKVKEFYIVMANSELQDAIQLFNSDENICANIRATLALENAIGALNAHNGTTNLKEKWIPKIFYNNRAKNPKVYEKYLDFQVYSRTDYNSLPDFIENKLEFIQDIISMVSIDGGEND